MSTVIDSLQIDIQSNSTTAAGGIDALATSLGKLKNNGAFKTVVNNLNGLSDSLKKLPNVHNASNALRTLANSIEKLKGVGTVSGLTNSLAKLPTALKSLESINLDRVAPQIQRVADAFTPLSTVKAGGLGTAVNALSKLKKVTDSLDDDAIEAFAKKIEILVNKLEPLSKQMTTIQAGFKGMNAAIKQTNVSIDQTGANVNVGVLNFSNLATAITAVHSALQTVIQGFATLVHSASEWDGIAARFGRGFGAQAGETYAWIQRLNEELGINIQQFMQHSSIYANMLTGFGVASEDAGKMALGYMELTYDIWAGYNDIYGSLEETAEAVRSAIAGEVEPVRRAGFTIIESTLEQTAKNHGLAISIETATEAQKSYLRYLTLVDQAHAQSLVGTYAKEMNTAEGMMRTFNQQLKSLTQAFGSLFLPILVKVMPYVQAFVELLTEGVHWLGALLGIEIQDISNTWGDYNAGISDATQNTQGVTDALGDATKAAKELKNASLGIDELNVISPPTASGSSGGAGSGGGSGSGFEGLDIDSLWDETIFDNIQSDVDAIKEKMKGWLPVIGAVATALAGLRLIKLINDLKDLGKIAGIFTGIATAFGFIKDYVKAVVAHIPEVGTFAAIFPKLSTWLLGVWGWLIKIADWVSNLAGPYKALIVVAIVAITSSIYYLTQNWNEFKQAVADWFAENIGPKIDKIRGHFEKMGEALEPVTNLLKPIVNWCRELIESIDWSWLGTVVEWIGAMFVASFTTTIAVTISVIAGNIENLIQIFSGGVQLVTGFFDALFSLLTLDFDGFLDGLSQMDSGLRDVASGIAGLVFDPLVDTYKAVASWWEELYGTLTGKDLDDALKEQAEKMASWFWDDFIPSLAEWPEEISKWFTNLWQPIKDFDWKQFGNDIGTSLGTAIGNAITFITETIPKKFEEVKASFETFFTETLPNFFSQKIPEATDSAASWFEELPSKILNAITSVDDWFADIGEAIIDGIIEGFDTIGTAISDFVDGFVQGFKDALGIKSPSTVFADIGKNCLDGLLGALGINSIKEKVVTMWGKAGDWWEDTKGTLSTYTPSIGNIQSKLSSAWNTAKTWWNEKKSALKEYTPSIGSIYNKVKDRWDNARTWWNDKKAKMKEYTPSIGSIYEKVYDRWKNARDWWNSKKSAMKTYTPSIGSITDKVKSAWNSAKSWWNKNVKLSTKLDIKVPKIKVQWDTASAFGKSFKYPTGFKLEFAAAGGVFDMGSLIWAGERGPEVLANAGGGRTGVMNVQQMQDAVYEGVYAAVSAAMRGANSGGAQEINVYLDGRQVEASISRVRREKGASIVGNELYGY